MRYMKDTTTKLKFSKASFLHYCQNPYVYEEQFGGSDTIVTMEIIQAPKGLQTKSLEDPQLVKKQQQEARGNQIKEQKAAAKAEAKRLKKEASKAIKEQEKA